MGLVPDLATRGPGALLPGLLVRDHKADRSRRHWAAAVTGREPVGTYDTALGPSVEVDVRFRARHGEAETLRSPLTDVHRYLAIGSEMEILDLRSPGGPPLFFEAAALVYNGGDRDGEQFILSRVSDWRGLSMMAYSEAVLPGTSKPIGDAILDGYRRSGNAGRDRRRSQAEREIVAQESRGGYSAVPRATSDGYHVTRETVRLAILDYVRNVDQHKAGSDDGPPSLEWDIHLIRATKDGSRSEHRLAGSEWQPSETSRRYRLHDAATDALCVVAFGKARPPWPGIGTAADPYELRQVDDEDSDEELILPHVYSDPLDWARPWAGLRRKLVREGEDQTGSTALNLDEAKRVLDAANLTEKQAAAFYLCVVEGMEQATVAAMYGVQQPAISKALKAAGHKVDAAREEISRL